MKHLSTTDQQSPEETLPLFSYELLRDILIPELLGEDASEVSYWAGKHLARKFPLLTIEEKVDFFKEAGWGNLQLIHEKRNKLKLQLSGHMIDRRLRMNSNACFRLEAGFIAEQIQQMKHSLAETLDDVDHRKKRVTFIVRWDPKDQIQNENEGLSHK